MTTSSTSGWTPPPWEPPTAGTETEHLLGAIARMRTTFTGGSNAGDPTSSGDTFTNTARLTATTNPAPGVNPPAPTGPGGS